MASSTETRINAYDSFLALRNTSSSFHPPWILQELTAPLFEELADSQPATYLPHAFLCEPSAEISQLYVDEDSLSLWGVHAASQIELFDDDRLAEKHIVDQAVLRLRVLPALLDQEDGGRVFVETKAGLLPLLGIRPTTRVRFLKEVGEMCSVLGWVNESNIEKAALSWLALSGVATKSYRAGWLCARNTFLYSMFSV